MDVSELPFGGAVLQHETLVPTRGYITGSLRFLSIHVAASPVYM